MKVEMPQPDERTLLIVDDEINLGAAIRRMLRNKGYKDDGLLQAASRNADDAHSEAAARRSWNGAGMRLLNK